MSEVSIATAAREIFKSSVQNYCEILVVFILNFYEKLFQYRDVQLWRSRTHLEIDKNLWIIYRGGIKSQTVESDILSKWKKFGRVLRSQDKYFVCNKSIRYVSPTFIFCHLLEIEDWEPEGILFSSTLFSLSIGIIRMYEFMLLH